MQYILKIGLIIPALFYGIIVWLRNWMYDHGYLHEQAFDFPVINVGNLAAGGTGKTPHIEYLIKLLISNYHIATLSRGYKRNTTGFRMVEINSTEEEVGDEPLLFKLKFSDVSVYVGEDRLLAIPQILHLKPNVEVILLDDAFQHRSVQPGLNILLTDFHRPFYDDQILPLGYLRDSRKSYLRADIIIVTKCPVTLTQAEEIEIKQRIKPTSYQRVFFSIIEYQPAYAFFDFYEKLILNEKQHLCIIAGIANENPLIEYVSSFTKNITVKKYRDHFRFDESTINDWNHFYQNNPEVIFITTEKDAVRLTKYNAELRKNPIPLYVLPIEIKIIGSNKEKFNYYIHAYIHKKLYELGRINNESLLE